MRRLTRTLFIAAVSTALSLASSAFADEPVSIEKVPTAGITPLFDGMTSGSLEAKLVMKDAMHGSLVLKNLTDEPLNVSIPEAFGGKQILGQAFGGIGAGGGGQQGGAQQTGGGAGGAGAGAGAGDSGFFSIPPQKVKSVKYQSVCLEHGKPEPMTKMHYVPVPVEEVTQNPALEQLLIGIGKSNGTTQAMQAAAWHLSDNMSWGELAAKKYNRAGRPDTPYFSRAELMMAQEIVAESKRRAEEAEKSTKRL